MAEKIPIMDYRCRVLTSAYSNRIGLKGYDFTISDEPARENLWADQLKRIYVSKCFEKVAENAFAIDERNLPTTKKSFRICSDGRMLFIFQVGNGNRYNANGFWTDSLVKTESLSYQRLYFYRRLRP